MNFGVLLPMPPFPPMSSKVPTASLIGAPCPFSAAQKKRKPTPPSKALSVMPDRRSKRRRCSNIIAMLPEDPHLTSVNVSSESEVVGVENAEVEISGKEIDTKWSPNQRNLILQNLAPGKKISKDELFWILENLPTGAARILRPSHENQSPLSERERFILHPNTRKTGKVPAQWVIYSIDLLKRQVTQFGMPHIDKEPIDPYLLAHIDKIDPTFREGKRGRPLTRALYHEGISDSEAINDSALFSIMTCLQIGFDISPEQKTDSYLFRWFLQSYFDESWAPEILTDHLDSVIDLHQQNVGNHLNHVIAELDATVMRYQEYSKHVLQNDQSCILTKKMRNAAAKDVIDFCNGNNLNGKHINIKNLRRCCAEADIA